MTYPALHGLVDQIPVSANGWPQELRDQWLEALQLVLDYSISVNEPVAALAALEDR
jgi:hypothetical protein